MQAAVPGCRPMHSHAGCRPMSSHCYLLNSQSKEIDQHSLNLVLQLRDFLALTRKNKYTLTMQPQMRTKKPGSLI